MANTPNTQNAVAKDGTKYPFVFKDNPPGGAMKDIYFAPDKSYVVGIYHKEPDARGLQRLESIVGSYRRGIFDMVGGEFWKKLFCWPETIVSWNGRTGIVVPHYHEKFFFQFDPEKKGQEKKGQWFASAKLFHNLDPRERGNFLNYLKISLKCAQAVRRLHAAGLAHSDLSFNNVLINPHDGDACIIDLDGLVVPGKYNSDVLGTPGFIAPEVLCDNASPRTILPTALTDRHALAVLIYMYLLHRHPLQGGRWFDDDIDDEEFMLMGKDPLYIEHPTNHLNHNMKREYGDDYDFCLPWVDLDNFSAERIAGPFLAPLFRKAFIDGLASPNERPLANDWEQALVNTTNLLQPCANPNCQAQWYIYDGTRPPRCPFCGTAPHNAVPRLEFSMPRPESSEYLPENRQLMVWHNLPLHRWHVNRNVFPNERLTDEDRLRQAYCVFHKGQWLLVNERLTSLREILPEQSLRPVRPGQFITLEEGKKIILSTEPGGRLATVRFGYR